MIDFGFMDTPIEIASVSPRYEMITARLRDTGLRPYRSSFDTHPSDPILIDAKALSPAELASAQQSLTTTPDRPVVVLAERGEAHPDGDIVLFDDGDLVTLNGRLGAHRRAWLQNDEARLRRETIARISGTPPVIEAKTSQTPTAVRILYIGDGSPYFLALQSALKQRGAEIVAALTTRTALDYLESQTFSALLVDLTRNSDQAGGLMTMPYALEGARNILRIACLGPAEFQTETTRKAISGADEILDASDPVETSAERILLSASRHQVSHTEERTGLTDPDIIDPLTGLYTANFLEAHLDQQMRTSEHLETPLSVLTLRLRSAHDEDKSARAALPQLASLILPALRGTDCAARLDWTMVAISLRGVNYSGATRMAERIALSLGGDEIGMAGSPLPFGGSLSWRVAERRRYHTTASDLLSAALATPYKRLRRSVA